MNKTFEEDRRVLCDFFNERLQEGGNGPVAVGWGSIESQATRFRVLSQVGSLEGCSLLDVGCGLGALSGFLTSSGIKLRKYVGIDITAESVTRALVLHPRECFLCEDVFGEVATATFDYVVASGTFNLMTPNALELTLATFRQMYALCEKGVAVNFLSAWSPFPRDEQSIYYDPIEILTYAFTELNRNVVLRHDYWLNDFTLYVYKRDCG